MARRVSPEAALLMLHWQNSVCDPKGVLGQNCSAGRSRRTTPSKTPRACSRPRAIAGSSPSSSISAGAPAFPNCRRTNIMPLLQGANDEHKGIVGTWESMSSMRSVRWRVSRSSISARQVRGHRSRSHPRANAIGHLFVSGQCIEHVVATTIRAANMGYIATLIKNTTSGFTDSNYRAMLDILRLREADHVASAAGRTLWRHGAHERAPKSTEFFLVGLLSSGRDGCDGRPSAPRPWRSTRAAVPMNGAQVRLVCPTRSWPIPQLRSADRRHGEDVANCTTRWQCDVAGGEGVRSGG